MTYTDNVAEWLRRLPAKQFPFGSVGSNPAVVVFYKKERHTKNEKQKRRKKIHDNNGDAGYRSPCPSHAKRMLYHLSYTPIHKKRKTLGVVSASFNLSNILWGLYKKNKNSPTGIRTPVFHVTG